MISVISIKIKSVIFSVQQSQNYIIYYKLKHIKSARQQAVLHIQYGALCDVFNCMWHKVIQHHCIYKLVILHEKRHFGDPFKGSVH